MEETQRTTVTVFLLWVTSVMLAEVQTLDVCVSCHANATCDDKPDGSGKVCNCQYGFVGDGRTFCQDKDECQIGSFRICGPFTYCHNTYGSFYCTCMPGYRPSSNMDVFIPNDGTHCQDVDECRISGLCGVGGVCNNLPGSFECSCQLGYEVHNGPEPFNPRTHKSFCKVVDCGRPPTANNMVLQSAPRTTYGSVAKFACGEGFVWRSGDNSSVCGANRSWTGLTAVCEEISCGDPPVLPHTGLMWNGSSSPGSTVTYFCKTGFYHSPGNQTSSCTNNGYWTRADILCREVDCGVPPPIPHSVMLWANISTVGSEVVYQCESGYHRVGGGNVSVCAVNGEWEGASLLCQEIRCPRPVFKAQTKMLWDGSSHVGSVVYYQCEDGFYTRGLKNYSVCGEDGLWEDAEIWCEEISCGDPPVLPHTGLMWNGSSSPGSTVTYFCKTGFYHSPGNQTSSCTNNGYWTRADILCREVDCGVPPPIPHSVMLWANISTVGSEVVYQCESGYHRVGGGNVSVCAVNGEWEGASLLCQEIRCPRPVFKAQTEMLWDGSSHVGSVVYYQCEDGFYTRGLKNYSVCGEDGLWQDAEIWCEDITCGPPLNLPHTNLQWDGSTKLGSVVIYECVDGFYQDSGQNVSTCLLSGEWGEVSVRCKAECGPAPSLNNSDVIWHNSSAVIHRCVDGFHSWRGRNVSVCGSSGEWDKASIKCVERKPPINHLFVTDEKCVHWKAEKYEEDTEVYKVIYVGSRDYQKSFHDKRRKFMRSENDQLKLCLDLLPVTNYSISVTAVSARFTITIQTNTSLTVPPTPVVYYREFETPAPTLKLRRSHNTLDPISLYQVFVLSVEGVTKFNCSSPAGLRSSSRNKPSSQYITATIQVRHVGTEINFTVGDGLYYDGFFNAQLKLGRSYYIILRAVSQWKTEIKSTCVLWAKVKGTSHVLKVSAVSAASVVVILLVILGGFQLIRFLRRS